MEVTVKPSHFSVVTGAAMSTKPSRFAKEAVLGCEMGSFSVQNGLFWRAKWPVLHYADYQVVARLNLKRPFCCAQTAVFVENQKRGRRSKCRKFCVSLHYYTGINK